MPVRGNEWYYHNMSCYCLDMDIIILKSIKYVIKSSLLLPKRYYNKFIDYCYKNIENYSKLAINSMIGNFKPNLISVKHGFQNHLVKVVVMHSPHL